MFNSCDVLSNRNDEGIITYEITYPKPIADKSMEKLMPKEMDVQFKGGHLKTELSFGYGMINIAYLSNHKKKELNEMLVFLKKGKFATRDQASITEMMKSIPPHKITPGNATKMIAGYTCKNAIIEVRDDTTSYDFECWYTEELGDPEINWCSPFSPIKGMLMEYQIERLDVAMKFTASQVKLIQIPDEEFSIPDGYKKISCEKMKENLQELKEI